MTEGISEEQLAALTLGRWSDDVFSTPGWERRVTIKDTDGEQMWGWMKQWVYPSRLGWVANSNDENLRIVSRRVGSLEAALKWCDDRAGANEIVSSAGTATRQEDRFVSRTFKD